MSLSLLTSLRHPEYRSKTFCADILGSIPFLNEMISGMTWHAERLTSAHLLTMARRSPTADRKRCASLSSRTKTVGTLYKRTLNDICSSSLAPTINSWIAFRAMMRSSSGETLHNMLCSGSWPVRITTFCSGKSRGMFF